MVSFRLSHPCSRVASDNIHRTPQETFERAEHCRRTRRTPIRTPMLATVLASLLVADAVLLADEAPKITAYIGGRIHTVSGQVHDPGTLVVSGKKILTVGPRNGVRIPDGAQLIDITGKVVIPGLVDTHSHIGVSSRPQVSANSDGNEATGPVQSSLRALDGLNPNDPGIRMANAGGITTANIMPGSANVIGGQTVYVKLRHGTTADMLVEAKGVLGGLKMANGENPKRTYGRRGQAPGTRMKVASLQRSEFIKARNYKQKWDSYRKAKADGEADAEEPDRDLMLEPLLEVLEGRRTVHFHTHRADDILTVLRLRNEFMFDLVIQHGTEAFKVIDQIARNGVPVSMTVVDSPGGKAEVVDLIEECGAELHRAGIPVIVNTDDPVTESRFFLRTAAIPLRGGLSETETLKAITLTPATAMRLEHRVGSLEAGKDADFVILSGAPFSVFTRVLKTVVDGEVVFDLSQPGQSLFQTGGFAIDDPGRLPAAPKPMQPPAPTEIATAPEGAPKATNESQSFAILATRIHTVSNGTLRDGAILVRDGKIAAIGARNQVEIPAGTPVLTAAEVTPGLIDAHSVAPLAGEYNIPADQDSDETSDPNQADVRVLDAFNPSEPLMRFLLEQGVTVIHACPGRANVVGGTTGVFRTTGQSADEMAIRYPFAMLFNLGERPKETYSGQKPTTRMGTASLIRSALNAAANAASSEDDEDSPEPDLKTQALQRVIQGDIRAMFCAQRSDDLQTALRLSREFQLKPVLALGAEAYQLTDAISEQNVPVIVHPTMQRIGGIETYNTILNNAAALADANIQIAIGSAVEGYVPKTRVIRGEAAIAMVYGLGFDRALKAITLDAATILGIQQDHGSLDVGKVADIVLYDGHPFENSTHVTHVVSAGRIVHDRSTQENISVARRMLINANAIPCCVAF